MAEDTPRRFGAARRTGDHAQLPPGEQRPQIGGGPGKEVATRGDQEGIVPASRMDQYALIAQEARVATAETKADILIDTTGSMQDKIDEAEETISQMGEYIATEVPVPTDLRVIGYKDYEQREVLQISDRSKDPKYLRQWVGQLQAFGGSYTNDLREAIECALLRSLSQDPPNLIFLVGDQPPHLQGEIPLHLPDRRIALELARECGSKKIAIYPLLAGREPAAEVAFKAMADASGGVFGYLDKKDTMFQMISLAIVTKAAGVAAGQRLAGRLQLTVGSQDFFGRLQITAGSK